MKLIVSEKDNTAKRIAAILSANSVKTEKVQGIPVYRFQVDGAPTISIGLKGHILKVDYPEEYNNWQDVDPIKLIDAPLIKVPSQKRIVKALQSVAEDADEIIIATDFDREGELIGVEALDKIAEVRGTDLPIHRARFSSLTKGEITKSFTELQEVYRSLAEAGETRQDIDLIWGATLTRFISLASTRLGKQFLSVGRVQSPTLALIVEREGERDAFVPEPYWQVKARLSADGAEFLASHKTERFLKQGEAEAAHGKIAKEALVSGVKRTENTIQPPAPFNTTAFLSAAASIGVSPAAAMNIAETLYMDGKISYPRVDNTVYPPTLDLIGIAKQFNKSSEFRGLAELVLAQPEIKPTRGKKEATDHPPIHPTGVASKSKLGPREWKIYELVVRRFMATLAPPAKQESLRVDFDANGEPLFSRGLRTLYEGWLACYPYTRRKEEELPELSEGDKVKVQEAILEAKQTQPPARYSQSKLIETMEKLGLGTKATRHAIIQNLYERSYVHGDPVEPTETGRAVIDALRKYAAHITTPEMTADLERSMDEIAERRLNREQVLGQSRDMLRQVMDDLEQHKGEFGEMLRQGIRQDQILGTCPTCGKPMRVIRAKKSRKRFAGCSGYPDCSTSFPLPQFGGIIPLGSTCEHCNSPMIKVVSKGSRPWTLCINPECPGKEQAKKAGT